MDFNVFDQIASGYAMPVFGTDTPFSRSPPPTMDENFLNMLFNANGMGLNDPSPPDETASNQSAPADQHTPLPKAEPDDPSLPTLSHGFNIDTPQSTISDKAQERLFNLVNGFRDIDDNPGRRSKAEIQRSFASNKHSPALKYSPNLNRPSSTLFATMRFSGVGERMAGVRKVG